MKHVCMFFFLRKQRNAEPPAKTHMAITLTIFLGGTLVGIIMLRAWLPCLLEFDRSVHGLLVHRLVHSLACRSYGCDSLLSLYLTPSHLGLVSQGQQTISV